MEKNYTAVITQRTPRPRSKRLREMGIGSSAGATVVMSGAAGGTTVTGDGHTHANLSVLNEISTDTNGYQYLTQLREVENTETGDTTVERVTDKVKAGYADKAAIADDLTPDSPVRSQFLSRLAADTAAGRITFEEGLHALTSSNFDGGIYVGDYTEGMEGAIIDPEGNAEVESITARSYLKVYELIYNRINALEGNTSFADTGTIEAEANDGQLLTMRKRWEGDFTAFQPGDIVYGYVNDLEGTNGGQYYKAWARVQSVDRAANKLTVVYYPASETPAKVNYKLRRGMVITRWGNAIEANAVSWANEDYKAVIEKRDNGYFNTRQSSFFISCEDGNLVELMGVNKPVLSAENYGTVLGRIPEGLLDSATEKLINKDQPYLYARGIIVQDLIRVDYRGVVTRVANYRGTWSAATAASETDYYRSTAGAYDTVTWNNCLWQCVASGTTDEPSDSTGSWVNMSGGAEVPKLSVWKIMPNTDIVTFRYDAEGKVTIQPKRVTCNVLLTDTEIGTKTYSSSLDLSTDYGVKLWYSIDGATWKEFVIGNTEPLETEDSEAFEAEASTADNPKNLTLGGDDVASELIGDRIYFELRSDTDVLARSVIPVVKDGKEGTDGIMVYPAGAYSADITYTADNETSPVVAYDGNYYMLIRGKSYNGATMPEGRRNPAEDVANGGDDVRWRLFEKFNAVFADVIMANFAKLGGAVFYGDYMFSQSGTINGTEVSGVDAEGKAYYRQFTDGVTYGTFLPYLMLNFQTGELNAEKGKFRGTIQATAGSIGGFTISSDHLGIDEDDESSAGMSLYSKWLRFQNGNQTAMLGTRVLPGSYGTPLLGRFVNNEVMPLTTNYGFIFDVSGGENNIAMCGKGNVVMQDLVTGYGVKTVTLKTNTVSHEKFDQATHLITCTVTDAHYCLPDRYTIAGQLGISDTTPFSVRVTIIAAASNTENFKLQGRNTSLKNSAGTAFLDDDSYPYRLNNNAQQQLTDGLDMGAGDIAEYQLVYDGTTYNAYLLNNRQ